MPKCLKRRRELASDCQYCLSINRCISLWEETGIAASSLRSAALLFLASPLDGGSKFLRSVLPNHRWTSICNKILIYDDNSTSNRWQNLKSRKCCSVVCLSDSVKLYRFTVEPSPAPTCCVGLLLAPYLPPHTALMVLHGIVFCWTDISVNSKGKFCVVFYEIGPGRWGNYVVRLAVICNAHQIFTGVIK